jgi:LacI family transcriptional regulator
LKIADVNSAEIARLAGVSRTTVSRVINDYPNVRKKTRDRVLQVIEEQNYYPSISGRVLRGKKTFAIGLFIIGFGDIAEDVLTNLMISSVIKVASANNYYVLTQMIPNIKDRKEMRNVQEVFYQKRVDAGIFVGGANHEPLIEGLIAEGFVIGVVDQDIPGRQEPNRIVMNYDTLEGTDKIIRYLAELKHTKIGMISGDLKRHSGASKYNQFFKTMEQLGLKVNPSWIVQSDFNEKSGHQAMTGFILKNKEFPTAIFAASDSIAYGALRAMQEHGLKVPEDISLIGYDDQIISSYINPALTTLRIDYKGMMKSLTMQVITTLESDNRQFISMCSDSQLIIRESCSPL